MPTGIYARRQTDYRKGKTYVQIYGEARAKEICEKKRYKYTKEQLKRRIESRRKNGWNRNDKETKKKQSIALLGRKWSKERKDKLKIAILKSWTKERRNKYKEFVRKRVASKKPTKIEKILYAKLDELKIQYRKQETINNKFIVDAYIPQLNLVIEVDERFWHSIDRVKRKDYAENAYLQECKYSLLRIAEETIKSTSFNLEKILQNYSPEADNQAKIL